MKFFDKLRYATNSIALILLNLNLFGFSLKGICAPGFVCHGCPWATFACPVGAVAYGFSLRMFPFYALGSILAIGLIFSRLVCSYVCPFGFLQDLLYKIPSVKKFKIPRWTRYGKYIVLAVLVVLLPFIFGLQFSTSYVDIKFTPERHLYNFELMVLSDISVQNLSDKPIDGLPLTVSFINANGEPIPDFKEINIALDKVKIDPHQTVKLENIEVPSIFDTPEHSVVLSSPLSRPTPAVPYKLYVCEWCPLGELTAALPNKIERLFLPNTPKTVIAGNSTYTGHVFIDIRFSIMAIVLILMVIISRPFCRVLCPLGALFALVTPFSVYKLKLDSVRCINCGQCDKVCPMGLNVRKEVGSMECIFCNNCVKRCPTKCIHK